MPRRVKQAPAAKGGRAAQGGQAAQAAQGGQGAQAPQDRVRLDVWLWRARFYKTRALAASAVSGGKIRVNRERVSRPGQGVKLGDVLTFAKARRVIVVEIAGFGVRRGPPAEARTLYRDLSDPAPSAATEGPSDPPGDEPSSAPAPIGPLDAGDALP